MRRDLWQVIVRSKITFFRQQDRHSCKNQDNLYSRSPALIPETNSLTSSKPKLRFIAQIYLLRLMAALQLQITSQQRKKARTHYSLQLAVFSPNRSKRRMDPLETTVDGRLYWLSKEPLKHSIKQYTPTLNHRFSFNKAVLSGIKETNSVKSLKTCCWRIRSKMLKADRFFSNLQITIQLILKRNVRKQTILRGCPFLRCTHHLHPRRGPIKNWTILCITTVLCNLSERSDRDYLKLNPKK